MTQANCPSCGAVVPFRAQHSLYAVCAACGSLLVRQDVDVRDLGKVAQLQPDGTPLCLGARGSWRGHAFEIVGRLQVQTASGGFWNEWYLVYGDGREGWLGEAMGEYLINFATPQEGLPPFEGLQLGQGLMIGQQILAVTELGHSRVVSYEGEIPFIMQSGYELLSADLRGPKGEGATLDYSDGVPALFLGEYVNPEALSFSGLRTEEEERASGVRVKAFQCPSCGAPQELKTGGLSQVLVCAYCDAALDTRNPEYARLYQAQQASAKVPALIPLGSRGTFGKVAWDCVGFLRRCVTVDGMNYSWSEYLLYERLRGYRWLTETQGHWTWVEPLGAVPTHPGGNPVGEPPPAEIYCDGKPFKHFQRAVARVTYVIGEFYWRVQAGETARCDDYVAPPASLSAEMGDGIVWSRGLYLTGAQVWHAFGLKGQPPAPVGVGMSQPNPSRESRDKMWLTYLGIVMLGFFLMMGYSMKSQEALKTVSYDCFKYEPERSRITDPFPIGGRGNVEIAIETDVGQRWAWFQLTLINQDTSVAYDTGTTVSYYADSDGSEGSRNGSVILPCIPAGTYLLRVEPSTGTGETPDISDDPKVGEQRLLHYTLRVYRDVPEWMLYWMMVIVLIVPPIWVTWKSSSMETRRWSESDYAPGG